MKKKYVEDYKLFLDKTSEGKVKEKLEYTGKYYWFNLDNKQMLRFKILFGSILMVELTLFILMGVINNDGSRILYVLLPYVCGIMPFYYLISAFFAMPGKQMDMEYVQYDTSYVRSKKSAVGIMVCMALAGMGDIIFVVRNMAEIEIKKEFVFFLLSFLIFLLNFIFIKFETKVNKCINIRESKILNESNK